LRAAEIMHSCHALALGIERNFSNARKHLFEIVLEQAGLRSRDQQRSFGGITERGERLRLWIFDQGGVIAKGAAGKHQPDRRRLIDKRLYAPAAVDARAGAGCRLVPSSSR
jgi:hypothetical protein